MSIPTEPLFIGCAYNAAGDTIEAYHGTFESTDLSERPLLVKEYGKGTLAVKISTFGRHTIALPSIATDLRGI